MCIGLVDFLYFSELVFHHLFVTFGGNDLPELAFSTSGVWRWLLLLPGVLRCDGYLFLITCVLVVWVGLL